MIAEKQFVALIGSIVEKCVPDETEAFQLGGDKLVSQVYQTGRVPEGRAAKAEFEFLDGAKGALEMLKVGVGLYQFLKSMLKPEAKKEGVTLELVAKEVTINLKATGLAPELAAEVAAKFGTVLTEIIAKHRGSGKPT